MTLPDGRIIEEVYGDGKPRFAIWDGKGVGYQERLEVDEALSCIPLVNNALTTGTVNLPERAEDYGETKNLVKEIEAHIYKYLDVSDDFRTYAAWYVLMSWIYDRLNTIPYLRLLGDTGTGKSRAGNVIGKLLYKCCMVSGAVTPAPIYRLISQWRGSLVIDEADFDDSSEKNEVIKILNCGYEKGREWL